MAPEKAETGLLPRKSTSQWSTLERGPLATREMAEIRAFAPIRRELVVHSGEWTTGSARIYLFMRPAPCSLFQNTKEALPLEWQGCLLLTGLFAVLGVGDPDA